MRSRWKSPSFTSLLDQFADAGISVFMWDMTSDVGIPVYCCSITDTNPFGATQSFGGSGCHLSKEIALSRALTEAAQSRLTFIAGSRDDLFPDQYGRRTTRRRPDNRPAYWTSGRASRRASVRRSPRTSPPRSIFSAPRVSRA